MIVGALLLLLIVAVVFGKAGIDAVKGLLMLAFGAILLMAGCAIV